MAIIIVFRYIHNTIIYNNNSSIFVCFAYSQSILPAVIVNSNDSSDSRVLMTMIEGEEGALFIYSMLSIYTYIYMSIGPVSRTLELLA